MSYYIDAEKVSLDELQKRIEETDLIPSRTALLEKIKDKFSTLKAQGILTLAYLRKELKDAKNISSLSKKAGIDSEYLTMLRREIEGYFPKAVPLRSFDWLPKNEIAKLESSGIKNAVVLYEALNSPKKISEIIAALKINDELLDSLYSLTDLTRIQWVSPIFARMILAAGYENAKKVSRADAEKLCNDLDRINKENGYFKGKIGLRDSKRLVKAASYVS